jgi:hypothetical protein
MILISNPLCGTLENQGRAHETQLKAKYVVPLPLNVACKEACELSKSLMTTEARGSE